MTTIVVNARYLNAGKMDGIGWFSLEVVRRMADRQPHIRFHVLVSEPPPADRFGMPENVVLERIGPPTKHATLNFIWFEWSVRRALQRVKPDLFLSLDGIACQGWGGPQYCVIHDLNFMHIPTDFKPSNRYYYRWVFPRSARQAARVGTVSEYSKQDLVQTFGVPAASVDVLYNATKSSFTPVPEARQEATRRKFTGGAPYFVFVGTLVPRKNLLRLIQAFELYKEQTGGPEKLLLAGAGLLGVDALRAEQARMKHGADVLFTGRVQQSDLNDITGSAHAMAFVSYFEGFGVPPLEAMACGVPVVAADATSIPEVVGDAALLVDPYEVQDIASGLVRVAGDPDLRNELIRKGFERKDVFTWDNTAARLWDGVRRCLTEAGVSLSPPEN